MSLIICANKVEREELKNLLAPEVDPTSRWRPIEYVILANLVHQALKNHGYEVVEEDHGVAKPAINGKAVARGEIDKLDPQDILWRHYFGGFALTHPDVAGDRRKIVVGMRNSYDKSLAASIVVGSKMMVCANLNFSAEMKISRKNTLNANRDLPAIIDDIIAKVMGHWSDMVQRAESYKEEYVSEATAGYILTHLIDVNALPARNYYPAICLFRNPASGANAMVDREDFGTEEAYVKALEAKKAEFTEEFGTLQSSEGSLWNLFNAFTYTLKGTSLDELPNRTMIAQAYFDSLVGFEAHVAANVNEVEASEEEQNEEFEASFNPENQEAEIVDTPEIVIE